jgi:hypothetical protein
MILALGESRGREVDCHQAAFLIKAARRKVDE